MNHPILADIQHCTGCMVCADSCAQKAISCIANDEGHYTYHVDTDKCILCHRCEKICPIVSCLHYGDNCLKSSQPFAAWSSNDVLRSNATSGGVFPSVAKEVLEQGGVVFGAFQEQFYVHHECIDTIKDICRLQGSKYTQSKTAGIYLSVKDALDKGKKVLFTGVGCQVAALLSFLKGNKNLDNLLTIDLICGGVPSTFLIKRYAEEYNGRVEGISSFRTKSKYELTVFDSNGKRRVVSSEERPLPLNGFTTGATKRYICYDCPFAKGHRMSDITIGDYWGNNKYPEQNSKGVSVAIAHSDKGRLALNIPELETHEIGWRDFLFRNSRMVYGKASIPKSRFDMAKAFSSYSYERLLEDYANKGSWKRPISILNRAWLILVGKSMERKRKQFVESILKDNSL